MIPLGRPWLLQGSQGGPQGCQQQRWGCSISRQQQQARLGLMTQRLRPPMTGGCWVMYSSGTGRYLPRKRWGGGGACCGLLQLLWAVTVGLVLCSGLASLCVRSWHQLVLHSRHSHGPHHMVCTALAFACRTQGILYEDTALQVGLQSRYTRSTGELLLFLGNKQAGQPLSGVSLVVSAPSPAVQVFLGQPPAQLAPKQQVQVGGELIVCLVHAGSALLADLLLQCCWSHMRTLACSAGWRHAGVGPGDMPAALPGAPSVAAALHRGCPAGCAGPAAAAGSPQVHGP